MNIGALIISINQFVSYIKKRGKKLVSIKMCNYSTDGPTAQYSEDILHILAVPMRGFKVEVVISQHSEGTCVTR